MHRNSTIFFSFFFLLNSSFAQRVVINEVMASNDSTSMVADEYGEYDDWIELYNMEKKELDLGGYFLTDDPFLRDKWIIPANTIIPPKGFLVIWADKDNDNMQKPLHTNFKLDMTGEIIILSRPHMEIADSVHFSKQTTNVAIARMPDGTGPFKERPATFKSSNASIELPKDQAVDLSFKLYPNPTMGTTSVEFGEFISVSKIQLNVVNVVGRVLQSETHENFGGTRIIMSTKDLKDGFYFLEVKSAKQKRTQRLVVRNFRP